MALENMKTAVTVKMDPFAHIRERVRNIFERNSDRFESHFVWLDEILEQAKKEFKKPDLDLLPKTPSQQKRKQRRGRQSALKKQSVESGNFSVAKVIGLAAVTGSVQKKSQGCRPSIAKARAGIIALVDDETDTDAQSDITETLTIPKLDLGGCSNAEPDVIVEEYGSGDHAEADHERSDHSQDENEPAAAAEKYEDVKETVDQTEQEARAMDQAIVVQNESIDDTEEFLTPEKSLTKVLPFSSATVVKAKPTLLLSAGSTSSKFLTPRVTPTSATSSRWTPNSSNRLTPQKTANKMAADEKREKLKQHLESANAKREEMLKQKIDETKKKREARAYKVAQTRLKQKAQRDEFLRAMEEKRNTPASVNYETKMNLRPRVYQYSATKPLENERKAMQEREKEKERERVQNEQEEKERVAAQERERQCHEVQLHCGASASTANLNRTTYSKPPMSLATEGKATVSKNSALFESKPSTLAKVTTPINAASPGTLNKSAANKSSTGDSYAMTPLRTMKPASANNYDISDLRSSDETDDEDHPRKKIPYWASGGQLKLSLTQQYYKPPDLNVIFGLAEMPDLSKMFNYQRKRFFKRTSSAKWDSPIRPHVSTQE